jgi:drug/metabolite transporter (DMT)-like permease
VVAWTQSLACLAWLGYFAASGQPFRWVPTAWPAIVASALLAVSMTALLARASARGDISIVAPIFALSPVFTVIPDAMLSGTLPTALGWVGLGLSVVGVAQLSGGPGAARGLRGLLRRRDALDALGAAILLGMLAAVDRWGALALGPPSYLAYSHGTGGALASVIALATTPRGLASSVAPGQVLTLLTHGVLGVTGTGAQTIALTMAPAAYVNALRRMSAVIAVLLGRALFREADAGRRLVAALLACAGAACLFLAR